MAEKVRHPVFARVWERIAPMSVGRGAGQGTNFPYYPDSVDVVVAVEPEEHLRRRGCYAKPPIAFQGFLLVAGV